MSAIKNFANGRLNLVGGDFSACHPISHLESAQLYRDCSVDIQGVLQKAILTYCYSLSGIGDRRYAWSTVQLYYSVYYSIHCILICNGVGLFHYHSKPGLIEMQPGGAVRKLTRAESKGGSHGSCLEIFRRRFPSHALNSPIGSEDSLEWIKKLRERVNYSDLRFADPAVPSWMKNSVGKNSVRKITGAYCSDSIYWFDPEHASVAFPLLALKFAVSEAKRRAVELGEDDRNAACSALRDDAGQLVSAVKFIGI